jgi:hypothetical protein
MMIATKRKELATLVTIAGVGVAIATILPTELLPQCPIHAVTGLLCPGCGTQRAAKAALSGDWAGAWNLNQLAFFVPAFASLGILSEVRKSTWLKWTTVSLAVIATVVFTIWRNL